MPCCQASQRDARCDARRESGAMQTRLERSGRRRRSSGFIGVGLTIGPKGQPVGQYAEAVGPGSTRPRPARSRSRGAEVTSTLGLRQTCSAPPPPGHGAQGKSLSARLLVGSRGSGCEATAFALGGSFNRRRRAWLGWAAECASGIDVACAQAQAQAQAAPVQVPVPQCARQLRTRVTRTHCTAAAGRERRVARGRSHGEISAALLTPLTRSSEAAPIPVLESAQEREPEQAQAEEKERAWLAR